MTPLPPSEPVAPPPAWYTRACGTPSEEHRRAALHRQGALTKPAGSLGRLEDVAVTLAALQGRDRPAADRVTVIVFAGDHGVARRGVSAYPPDVTVQMLGNFRDGGAAIAVLCRQLCLPLTVVDVGTAATEAVPGVTTDKVCRGTADFTVGAAMTLAQVEHALGAGRDAVARESDGRPDEPLDMVILGDMGIGNTTSAAALCCLLGGLDPAVMAGAGTGLDETGRQHKQEVLEQALDRHREALDPAGGAAAVEALCRVGGLELAALTGAIIGAAQRGIPVLVDGFIVTAAALVAVRRNPTVRPWLLFSHRSAERGHPALLELLDAVPLLDLDLRLGEGTGAAVALPLVRAACALHREMATFDEALISGRRP